MTRGAKLDGTTGQDPAFSDRRDNYWGYDSPCTDLDDVLVSHSHKGAQAEWLACEYAHGAASAIIEYKQLEVNGNRLAAETLSHPNMRAILSIPTVLPICAAIYQEQDGQPWEVWIPYDSNSIIVANPYASAALAKHSYPMDELTLRRYRSSDSNDTVEIQALRLGEVEWVKLNYEWRGLTCPEYVVQAIETGVPISKTWERKELDRRQRKPFTDLEG